MAGTSCDTQQAAPDLVTFSMSVLSFGVLPGSSTSMRRSNVSGLKRIVPGTAPAGLGQTRFATASIAVPSADASLSLMLGSFSSTLDSSSSRDAADAGKLLRPSD